MIEDASASRPSRRSGWRDGDAALLVEPVITYLFEGASADRARPRCRRHRRPSPTAGTDYDFGGRYVYPKGDTVWVVTAYGDAADGASSRRCRARRSAPAVPAPTPTPDAGHLHARGVSCKSLAARHGGGEPLRVAGVMADVGRSARQTRRQFKRGAQGAGQDHRRRLDAPGACTPLRVLASRASGSPAGTRPRSRSCSCHGRQAGHVGDEEPGWTAVRSPARPCGASQSHRWAGYLYPRDEVLWLVHGASEATLTESGSPPCPERRRATLAGRRAAARRPCMCHGGPP